jgi:hypothetical protein
MTVDSLTVTMFCATISRERASSVMESGPELEISHPCT